MLPGGASDERKNTLGSGLLKLQQLTPLVFNEPRVGRYIKRFWQEVCTAQCALVDTGVSHQVSIVGSLGPISQTHAGTTATLSVNVL